MRIHLTVINSSFTPVSYVQQLSASTEKFQYFASRWRLWGFQLPESSLKRQFVSRILSPSMPAGLTLSVAARQPLTRPLLAHFLPATQISLHHNTKVIIFHFILSR